MKSFFRAHLALPQEHGSWVFLFSPLLIGLFAGGQWTAASGFVVVAAVVAFLFRQPATMAVKMYSGRRARRDLPAARFWMGVYAFLGLLAVGGLVAAGFSYLLWLALPGALVFFWHLFLVSRRAERRQMGVELVGSGVLALAAPAAYWAAVGRPDFLGWALWILVWLQSAASIVYAYLRLEQRTLPERPPGNARWRMAARALAYTGFNLAAAAGLSLAGWLPFWVWVPFGVQFAETLWGAANPAVGIKPTVIGIRQLLVSTLFTVLFIAAWQIR